MRKSAFLLIIVALLVLLSSGSVSATWWNKSYDLKRNITDVPDVDLTLNVNGTSGFYGNRIFVNPANCNGDLSIYYKSTNTSDFAVVCNDTTEIAWTANDLISYWKFDNSTTSGTTSIDSMNVNNGTISGATTGVDGQIAEAYDFDGTNDYAESDSNVGISGADARSISFWFKWGGGGDSAYNSIVMFGGLSSGNMFAVMIRKTDDHLYFSGNANDYDTGQVVPTGSWHHVVATYSGTNVKTYWDGLSTPTTNQALTLDTTDSHFGFGARTVDQDWKFDGVLDEVGVWSRELTADEISDLYNNTKDGFNNMLLGAEESAPSEEAPTITAHATSPATVYTNTDFKFNMTATDSDNATFTGYVQFYINGTPSGSEQSTSMDNNTNTLIGTLSSSNFGVNDNLIAEYWAGDGTTNTTKTNATQVTVQSGAPNMPQLVSPANNSVICLSLSALQTIQ